MSALGQKQTFAVQQIMSAKAITSHQLNFTRSPRRRGHAVRLVDITLPPRTVMNSRRFIRLPHRREKSGLAAH